jgi:hypothetical protein
MDDDDNDEGKEVADTEEDEAEMDEVGEASRLHR